MTGGPFRMELFKLTRRPGVLLVFVLILIGFKGVALLAGSGGVDPAGEGSAFAYLAESASITMKLWWFLFLCLAAASLSGERSRGILRMHLARPVARGRFFIARLESLLLAGISLFAVDALAGIGFAAIFRTFGDVADPALQGPQFAASAMAFSLFRCYLLTFLGVAATISLGLLFSVICSNPTTAIAWAAGTGLVMEAVRLTVGEEFGAWMMTGYNTLHFEKMNLLARGIADYTQPGFWLMALGVPIGYFLILNVLSLSILKKSDISD
jgi:ABC-type transport system involved in multi-copper enzyme maturation permease subunit